LGWTAADEAAAAGTAAEWFFSEMPAWFHWKCILWAPKAVIQNVSRAFWTAQAAKAKAAAAKFSRRKARHVGDGGKIPLEVSIRGEAAQRVADELAQELLREYPDIQAGDVEEMCAAAVVALPQGGFGGIGGSTGVQAGVTAERRRTRTTPLRLPRPTVTGAEGGGGWRTRPSYLRKKGQMGEEEEQKRKEEERGECDLRPSFKLVLGSIVGANF